MNATLAKRLRFSDAVYAIETTPKALRNWLQRGLVQIRTPLPPDGGWMEYSFYDIALLSLIRKLVDFGVDVSTASGIANSVFTDFFPNMLSIAEPDEMPAGALAAMWDNTRLLVFPEGDGTRWRAVWHPLWDNRPDPAPAYISLDIEAIWRRAFERAAESADEGAD
jgi:hypothetical protein